MTSAGIDAHIRTRICIHPFCIYTRMHSPHSRTLGVARHWAMMATAGSVISSSDILLTNIYGPVAGRGVRVERGYVMNDEEFSDSLNTHFTPQLCHPRTERATAGDRHKNAHCILTHTRTHWYLTSLLLVQTHKGAGMKKCSCRNFSFFSRYLVL
jgi:hypothetical protein